MGVQAGAEPYQAAGGPVGVVLCHGFTGNPASLRPWAEHLAAAGRTVEAPRLPGHGTRWQDLNATRWTDWYGELERAFDRVLARCGQVFLGGLSMGGALALRLAEQRPADVAGVVVVNPSLGSARRDLVVLPALRHVLPSVPGIVGDIKKPGTVEPGYHRVPLKAMHSLTLLWRLVVADLGLMTAPTLLYRSRVDHVVEPLSARLLLSRTAPGQVQERILDNSYHVATLDNDAATIFAGSEAWISERGAVPPAAGRPARPWVGGG